MNTVLLKRKDDQVTKMWKLCEEQIYIGVNKKENMGKFISILARFMVVVI